jgi:glucose dehydrogenase
MLAQVAWAFSIPGSWGALNPTSVDVNLATGQLTFPMNLLGLNYNEVEVTYTAGLAVGTPAVKVACAQIVKNAQATPAMNVKGSKMDTLQMQYFSGSLIDANVQRMLAPYVAQRIG